MQPPSQPLNGLRVVELQAIGPVPFAGMLLRQLGATVTVVNAPGQQHLGLPVKTKFDLFSQHKIVQTMDLKSACGRTEFDKLLGDTDVMLEGFRPGVLERLDLGTSKLLESHPRLVIGRLSGFGVKGPLAKRAGHDINYLALSGALHTIGDTEQPSVPLNLVGDFGGGAMHLLVGVLAKLVERSISGQGGVVTSSILAGTIGLTPMLYSLIADGQWQNQRLSNLLDGGAPFYRVYPTQDKRFVAVGALEPKFFKQLLALTGLENEINAGEQYQRTAWPNMQSLFAARFRQRDRDDWGNDAMHSDCCVTPVLDMDEASRYPHNLANHWYTDTPFTQPLPVIDFTGGEQNA